MYLNWKNGISTYQFRKQQLRDVNVMKKIDEVVNQKKENNKNINEMMKSVERL